jgi:hypothetical protein
MPQARVDGTQALARVGGMVVRFNIFGVLVMANRASS